MDPVLVTGTSGLVGYQVALRLHEAGSDVLGLDVRPAPEGVPFRCVVGDVADLDTVMRLMQGRPNVVHAGAVSGPMLMLDDPHGIAQANLGGAMAVFEAAWHLAVRRLVWTSSIAVYGNQPTLGPVPEHALLNPQSFYGHTKVAGEALLHGYTARYGIAQANLGGAMAVFEAAWHLAVRRLVWTSSIAVYGNQPTLGPVPEHALLNPQSFYGHTKVAGEALLHGYTARYGLHAVALRLSSVFGVRRQTACALRTVIEAGRQGRPARVAAEGSSYRQYLHVDDAAHAVLLALSAEAVPGFAYNVTGGTYVTEAELARMIRGFMPGLAVETGPPAWNEGHLGPLLIDAATRDLGYRPRVALHDGLAELCGHSA